MEYEDAIEAYHVTLGRACTSIHAALAPVIEKKRLMSILPKLLKSFMPRLRTIAHADRLWNTNCALIRIQSSRALGYEWNQMFGVRSRRHRVQPTLKILPVETPTLKILPYRDLIALPKAKSFLNPRQPQGSLILQFRKAVFIS